MSEVSQPDAQTAHLDTVNSTREKEELYLRLLADYKYETLRYYDDTREKEMVEYKCGYPECGKVLQKPWNLLDHVRMHEGIKPYICKW